MSKTLLMVTYEFPPAGGPGVQRAAKLAKYLPRHGWRPVVLCAEPSSARPIDESLLRDTLEADVHRIRGVELSTVVSKGLRPFKRGGGGQAGQVAPAGDPSTNLALSTRLAAWMSFPDDRMPWRWIATGPAIRLADESGADAVFSTAPPYTAHLVAMKAARDRPWVADFRDPWAAAHHRYRPTGLHRSRDRAAEERVVSRADAITCISEPIAEALLGSPRRDPVVLPNGFDPEDLPRLTPEPGPPLRMVYTGTFYGERSPLPFLDGLAKLTARRPDLAKAVSVELIGTTSERFAGAVATRGLSDQVTLTGYRPHDESLSVLAGADVALLFIAPGAKSRATFTGKIFEYLGLGVPILAMAPDGVASDLVRRAKGGTVVAPDDPDAICAAIEALCDAKGSQTLESTADPTVVAEFDRSRQAAELAALLDDLVS